MAANEAWGLDIGQTAIHAVKVRRDGRRAAIADAYIQDLNTWPDDPEYEDKVLDALQTFARDKGLGKTPVIAGIPGFMTIFRDFPTPVSSRLRDVVQLEIKQRIPYKIEEVHWDYHQMNFDGVGEVTIGAICCRRDIVSGILGILDQAKLSIEAMQVSSIGLINYLAYDLPPEEGAAQIVIDSGARGTDLAIFHEEAFWLRPLGTSGQDLTRAIMSKLSLPFDQAEQAKLGIARGGSQADRAFRVLEPVLKGLASETQRSLGFYRAQNRGVQILKKMLLCGNVYRLPGAAEFLAGAMDMTTELLAEPKSMAVDDAAAKELAKHWLVAGNAVGLALQGVGQARVNTNLLPRDRRVARAIQSKFKYAAIATGLVGATALFNIALSGGVRNADRYRLEVNQAKEVDDAVREQRRRYDELKGNSVKPEAEARTLVARATSRGYVLEAQTEVMAWFDRFNGPPLADRKSEQPLEKWAIELSAGQRTAQVRKEATDVVLGQPPSSPRQPSPNAEMRARFDAAKAEYGKEWPLLLSNLEEQLYVRASWLAGRAGRMVLDRMDLMAGTAVPGADAKAPWKMSAELQARFDLAGGSQVGAGPEVRGAPAADAPTGRDFNFGQPAAAPAAGPAAGERPVVAAVLSGHVILTGFGSANDALAMQKYLEEIRRQFAALEGMVPGSFRWEAALPPVSQSIHVPVVTPQPVPKPEPVVRPGAVREAPVEAHRPAEAVVAAPRAIAYETSTEPVTRWRVSFLYHPRAEREAAKAAADAAGKAP